MYLFLFILILIWFTQTPWDGNKCKWAEYTALRTPQTTPSFATSKEAHEEFRPKNQGDN